MIDKARLGHRLLVTAAALVFFGVGTGDARAQWGGGFGGFGGFGMWGFGPYIEQPGNYLNDVSLAQMNHVRGPMQNNVYQGNPNSYVNFVRDNGFVDRYYPDRRDPSYYGYAPSARLQRTAAVAGANANAAPPVPPRPRPLVPLKTFFNDKNQFVWSGDAPTSGDLKPKRDAFEKACHGVMDEVKANGVASISTVTEARQKLLDYGRPGLQYVKDHETARVADGFHVFLLSLYDSLAQAAQVH